MGSLDEIDGDDDEEAPGTDAETNGGLHSPPHPPLALSHHEDAYQLGLPCRSGCGRQL
jgi:hypothetical protein